MKILLIRLRLIGDVVLTTPAIRAIRRRYPSAHLTYLVEPASWPVVRSNPHLDVVLVAERPRGWRQWLYDARLARRLRAARYDLVIDFHGGPRSWWLTWLSGAPRRIGYDVMARGWMYTTRVARPRELRPRHSVESQWDLLSALEFPPPDPSGDPVEMPLDAEAAAAVRRRLAAAGASPAHRLVVVHVSAGNPFRRWPAQAFADLIVRLARGGADRRIIITSGPSDLGAATAIARAAREALAGGIERGARERILDWGDLPLAELRGLLDAAALYVGGDSGPLHVAASTRVPIVGIYGPTLPVRSKPWRDPRIPTESVDVGELPCRPCDQRRCVPGDFRCLTTLAPQTVCEAAERALRELPKAVLERAR